MSILHGTSAAFVFLNKESSTVACLWPPAPCDMWSARLTFAAVGLCAGLGEDSGLQWVEGNAEKLPFEDASFDAYSIVFGIRNVTDIEAALREAHRSARPRWKSVAKAWSKRELSGLSHRASLRATRSGSVNSRRSKSSSALPGHFGLETVSPPQSIENQRVVAKASAKVMASITA